MRYLGGKVENFTLHNFQYNDFSSFRNELRAEEDENIITYYLMLLKQFEFSFFTEHTVRYFIQQKCVIVFPKNRRDPCRSFDFEGMKANKGFYYPCVDKYD